MKFEFDPSSKRLHDPDLDKRYHLDAPQYPQQNPSNSTEAFMDRKPEKVKMVFFLNFDLFFGISLVLPLNFTDVFAATDTDTTTYFKVIPIDIFMKKFFTDDL